MGKHGGEQTLLELAFLLEETMNWPRIDSQPIRS
jgi:amidase